jgi:hypothetical protein
MNTAAAASRAVEGAGRGASSLTDGVRNSEVIHCATADEITALLRDHEQEMLRIAGGNIENRRFVYTHSSKVNYVLPVSGRRWFYLRSVKLLNGDEVGVPVPFTLSAKAAENVVFLLLEVAGHVFDTCGRGSNVHFTLNAAAQWLADRHSKNRSTYHKGLQNLLLGRKELMLSDGTTVRLKDDNQGHAALFFNFDGRDDAL